MLKMSAFSTNASLYYAGATSPTAHSINSLIQTVHLFLMGRHSSWTSEILILVDISSM